jgi:hypothetical protein
VLEDVSNRESLHDGHRIRSHLCRRLRRGRSGPVRTVMLLKTLLGVVKKV